MVYRWISGACTATQESNKVDGFDAGAASFMIRQPRITLLSLRHKSRKIVNSSLYSRLGGGKRMENGVESPTEYRAATADTDYGNPSQPLTIFIKLRFIITCGIGSRGTRGNRAS